MLITTISFILFQIIGTNLPFSFSNYILKMSLGVTLVLFSVLFAVKEYSKWTIKSTNINSIIIGGFSGIIGGMLGIGGPPIVFYYHSVFEDKNDYNINTQATFAIVSLVMLGLHIYHGNINATTFKYSGLALIVLFISTLFGLRVFEKISKVLLTKIIIVFLFIAGFLKLVF